jgi:hypothetical protein
MTKTTKTKNEKELLEALFNLTIQVCAYQDGYLDSMCTYYSELELLAEYGKVKITSKVGRRILATII